MTKHKTQAGRIIGGTIFLMIGLTAPFDSGALVDNLATGVVTLVIAFFIFPKNIRAWFLSLFHQRQNAPAQPPKLNADQTDFVTYELQKIDQLSATNFTNYFKLLLTKLDYTHLVVVPAVQLQATHKNLTYTFYCDISNSPFSAQDVTNCLQQAAPAAGQGVLVTNQMATPHAIEVAQARHYQIWDRSTLAELLADSTVNVSNATLAHDLENWADF